jgi:hypothetical protein
MIDYPSSAGCRDRHHAATPSNSNRQRLASNTEIHNDLRPPSKRLQSLLAAPRWRIGLRGSENTLAESSQNRFMGTRSAAPNRRKFD